MSYRPRLPIVEIGPPPGTGSSLPRRDFLKLLATAVGSGAALSLLPRRVVAGVAPVFPDGIKAGDPSPRTGVIWTRVSPPVDGSPVSVLWSVAEDAAMQQVVRGGVASADAADGHSVKVFVRGLQADRWYYYRFEVDGTASVVGRL